MIEIFRKSILLYISVTLLFGTAAGYVDLHQSEVQPTVLLIAIFSLVMGFIKPKTAWLAAFIIGSSIFVVHLIAELSGFKPRYPVEPGIYGSLLALAPAFLFAYLGVFARVLFFKTRDHHEHPGG